MRCAPGAIFSILKDMQPNMKVRLNELGWTPFLGFNLEAIEDRALAMYIMEHVELNPLRIQIGERVLPLTPHIPKCVFAIPSGSTPLPVLSAKEKAEAQMELRRLCDLNGMKQMYQDRKNNNPKFKDYSQLKAHEVDRWVVEEFAKQGNGDDWSITCFFMVLFDALLFPTSSLSLSGETYHHCKEVTQVSQYDLCTAVIEDLTVKVGKWKISAEKRRQTSSVSMQGCVALLVVRTRALQILIYMFEYI